MAIQTEKVFEPFGDSEDVLASLLPLARTGPQPQHAGPVNVPVVGRLLDFDSEHRPVISAQALLDNERLVARSTVVLEPAHLGGSVVVLCENGDPRLPIVVGVIDARLREPVVKAGARKHAVQADGERYVIEGQREVVLRCGASSITLTRAGKVIIKGTYVLSRSSGYNKIKGAAVDIN